MTTHQIVIDPKIYGGKPCIRGTRIAVTMVLALLEDGLTFEQILKDYYPQLKAGDIIWLAWNMQDSCPCTKRLPKSQPLQGQATSEVFSCSCT